jgi:hypothetical protein
MKIDGIVDYHLERYESSSKKPNIAFFSFCVKSRFGIRMIIIMDRSMKQSPSGGISARWRGKVSVLVHEEPRSRLHIDMK